MAQSQQQAMDNVYEDLDIKEGDKKIYKIAKERNKATKVVTQIKQIKNKDGVVMGSSRDIEGRWKQYFERMLNEENPRSIIADENPTLGMVSDIDRVKIRVALRKMKKGKATGPNESPVEVWKCLGEFGGDMLWYLMKKIHQKEKMSRMWRNNFIMSIFEEKYVQNLNNYRAIKLLPHTLKLWERIIERR
ncbi:uncharacterized protein [Palaemon carinicauda]|uniref:uncharacterized protein n=1 Tax=Palaemon carinicauda TaxID=392227 RepID=UPI0035B67EDB